jgi:hypothetical protein
MVSAVTPVWSETKKTVRRLTTRAPYGEQMKPQCFTAVPLEQALCAYDQTSVEECL